VFHRPVYVVCDLCRSRAPCGQHDFDATRKALDKNYRVIDMDGYNRGHVCPRCAGGRGDDELRLAILDSAKE
jgi:hypothetical protein